MSTLALTSLIAFVLVVLAIAALSIGWLISGKSKIVRGACGTDPTKPKDKDCGTETSCGLCEKDLNERKANQCDQNKSDQNKSDQNKCNSKDL